MTNGPLRTTDAARFAIKEDRVSLCFSRDGIPFGTYRSAHQYRPRVFVSFHAPDIFYRDAFVRAFSTDYELVHDASLDERIDSTNDEYVKRKIREEYISGSSVTVVLCGENTYKRKHIDWEIHATVEKNHALIGLQLPHWGPKFVPMRLWNNIQTGYAVFADWTTSPYVLASLIDRAKNAASPYRAHNTLEQMQYNWT